MFLRIYFFFNLPGLNCQTTYCVMRAMELRKYFPILQDFLLHFPTVCEISFKSCILNRICNNIQIYTIITLRKYHTFMLFKTITTKQDTRGTRYQLKINTPFKLI